jgi:murein L,D-transpeptidase YcbB/YkuD
MGVLRYPRPACARALVTVLFAAALGGTPAAAQQTDELIRMRVEDLAASGSLTIDGESIAARQLLPRLYERRAFAPTWQSLAQVDRLLELIEEAWLEGLEPRDYHADAVRAARDAFADPAALPPARRAELDLLLTDSVIRLGYHLRFGKVDPVALDPHWNLSRSLVGEDPVVTIQAAIDSESLREFAAAVIPRERLYERLRNALAQYRAIAAAGGWPRVAPGRVLTPGMADVRVRALAERLAVTRDLAAADAGATSDLYDDVLVRAVQRFQQRHGLAADGVVGPATLAALNLPVERRIDQLRANLERARWVLYDPDSEFLVVNIAGFKAYLVRRGEIVWQSRVVVGRPYRRTPVFSATMTYLVFNPTWTVPPTILRDDILPEVRRNAGYLDEQRIDVFDAAGVRVDPATVDWSSAAARGLRLVQGAGAANALGRVKFMFPNEYSVYLHDTPSRALFERDSRAFSSGCIRVEQPLELAERLLGLGWDRARIEATIASGRTETVFLDDPMAVLLLYWTAEVDADGGVSFFPDLYGRDAALIEALAEPFRAPARL